MSIIYNALKKTQQQQQQEPIIHTPVTPVVNKAKRTIKFNYRYVLLAIVSLFFLGSISYILTNYHKSKPIIVKKMPILVLNGVMITPSEKIAMINNHEYHIGDKVSGMKITSMEMNSVKLRYGNKIIQIKNT